MVTTNLVKHELYPLFYKIVSVPSVVSAVTSGPASDFGGHFGGHISMAVSKVSAIFVSGADTSDTLNTSGRDKEEGCEKACHHLIGNIPENAQPVISLCVMAFYSVAFTSVRVKNFAGTRIARLRVR
jgi:hypothetical protein